MGSQEIVISWDLFVFVFALFLLVLFVVVLFACLFLFVCLFLLFLFSSYGSQPLGRKTKKDAHIGW